MRQKAQNTRHIHCGTSGVRTYFGIVCGAVLAFAGVWYWGLLALPGYIGSDNFKQSVLVEALSFIITTALLGSLSAAVVQYLEHRRALPIRTYAANKIEDALRRALDAHLNFLRHGRAREWDATQRSVSFGAEPVFRYIPGMLSISASAYKAAVDALESVTPVIEKFASVFPVNARDDLAWLADWFLATRSRIAIASSELGFGSHGYEHPASGITTQWQKAAQAIRDTIQQYKPDPGARYSPYSSLKLISDNEELLSIDTPLATGSYLNTREYQDALRIGEKHEDITKTYLHDMVRVDFSETLTDEEANTFRFPEEVRNADHASQVDWDKLRERLTETDWMELMLLTKQVRGIVE